MPNKEYTVWPVGKLPREWQRPELDQLKEAPQDILTPGKISKWAGIQVVKAMLGIPVIPGK